MEGINPIVTHIPTLADVPGGEVQGGPEVGAVPFYFGIW
jgi:hypothetical protein